MKKDITGLAVDRAAEKADKILRAVRLRVPYGPSGAQFSPSEVAKALKRMSGSGWQRLIQEIGEEKFMKLLRRSGNESL